MQQLIRSIFFYSAPSNPPNIKYLAIFCPSQFQEPQGEPYGPKMGVEKSIPGFQDTISLMFLSKILFFMTLNSQITNTKIFAL